MEKSLQIKDCIGKVVKVKLENGKEIRGMFYQKPYITGQIKAEFISLEGNKIEFNYGMKIVNISYTRNVDAKVREKLDELHKASVEAIKVIKKANELVNALDRIEKDVCRASGLLTLSDVAKIIKSKCGIDTHVSGRDTISAYSNDMEIMIYLRNGEIKQIEFSRGVVIEKWSKRIYVMKEYDDNYYAEKELQSYKDDLQKFSQMYPLDVNNNIKLNGWKVTKGADLSVGDKRSLWFRNELSLFNDKDGLKQNKESVDTLCKIINSIIKR